jgi:hypothetical protein
MLRVTVPVFVVLAVALAAGCGSGGSSMPTTRSQAGAGTTGGGIGASAAGGAATAGSGTGGAGGSFTASGAGGATGASGTIGRGGSSGAGGSSSQAGSVGCAALPLCDDFEGVAAGSAPDPTKWMATALSDCATTAPEPTVDASQHHSGTRSLKVAGTANFCDYAMVGNAAAFAAIGNIVYGRYWVRFETALPAGHTAFMIFPDQMSGHALRMGGQNSALQWNRQSDDATLPSQSPTGIALSKVPPVGDWMCLEFMIDQAQGLISTWVGGDLVAGLVADATPTADVDMAWGQTYRPKLTSFNLGWQNYGAGALNLWFDDVALSSTRIGCN